MEIPTLDADNQPLVTIAEDDAVATLVADRSDKADILGQCEEVRRRGEEGGFLQLKNELKVLNATLQQSLPGMSFDDAEEIMRAFYPMIFEGMKEIATTDEEIVDELEFAADTTFKLSVAEANLTFCLMIKDGEFDYAFDQPIEGNLTIHCDRPTLLRIMTGETEGIEAYMNGEVEAEGELMSCMGLRAIFERMSDSFGFQIMEFE